MKLNEQILKQLIREILTEAEENPEEAPEGPDAKLKTGIMSTQMRIKKSRERIKSAGDELDAPEQQMINQIEDKITEIAALPGVDLARYRPLLVRVLQMLTNNIAKPAMKKAQAQQQEPQKGTE